MITGFKYLKEEGLSLFIGIVPSRISISKRRITVVEFKLVERRHF